MYKRQALGHRQQHDAGVGAGVEVGRAHEVADVLKEQVVEAIAVEGLDVYKRQVEDIVKVNVYLADIMDLNAVEKVQASFFPTYQPARTVVAVDALPQGALVFIEDVYKRQPMARNCARPP